MATTAQDPAGRARWLQAKSVFTEVLSAPLSRRAEILDRLCGTDQALREQVEALLETHAGTTRFLRPWRRPESAAAEKPPAHFEGYEVLRKIGSGHSRDVWLARNRETHEECAIKALTRNPPPALAAVRESLTRAKPLRNLMPILGVAESSAGLFYVLPLADDAREADLCFDLIEYEPLTLERYLSIRAPLPAGEVLEIAAQLLDGVDDIHDAGFTHAKISPQKIVRWKGVWRLGDAGIIAHLHRFAPPALDQNYGPLTGRIDPSADVFAIARLLYRALTWRSFDDFDAVLARLIGDPDPSVRRLARSIAKACAAKPEKRFRNTDQMHASLFAPRRRSHMLSVVIAIVALAALVGTTTLWLLGFFD